jgi:hypothetical protein
LEVDILREGVFLICLIKRNSQRHLYIIKSCKDSATFITKIASACFAMAAATTGKSKSTYLKITDQDDQAIFSMVIGDCCKHFIKLTH